MHQLKCRFLTLVASLLLCIPVVVSADGGGDSDTPFNQQVNPQEVTAAYDAGYRQMKAGQYDDAIADFKTVIQRACQGSELRMLSS